MMKKYRSDGIECVVMNVRASVTVFGGSGETVFCDSDSRQGESAND